MKTLYHLRDNKIPDAIERQESNLDSELLTFMNYDSLSMDERDEGIIHTLGEVRKYRSKYPRKTDYPDIDTAVSSVLLSNYITNNPIP